VKFDPLHESQNSRTTWFVFQAPRSLSVPLCQYVKRSAYQIPIEPTHPMIFFKNIIFSSGVTCVLGNDSWNSACSSHVCARGWFVTSFLSGSLNLSNSLRAALPPIF